MSNKLKYIKDLKVNLDIATIKQLEAKAIKKINMLDGALAISDNSDLIDKIILMKEIIHNNKIENINTTYMEMINTYNDHNIDGSKNKTVFHNKEAIKYGKDFINSNGFISKQLLIEIQQIIRQTNETIRKTPVYIKNNRNKVIYEPIQGYENIIEYLNELEIFINDDFNNEYLLFNDLSSLSKLAIIHYQFEAIHPFSDANGRTGRILNNLYLFLKKEITQLNFSLSYYIFQNKTQYYNLLDSIYKNEQHINEFIIYMLKGIIEGSESTFELIINIKNAYQLLLNQIPSNLKIDKSKLIYQFNNLSITYNSFKDTLGISLNTAKKYLSILEQKNIVVCINKQKHLYLFKCVYDLLINDEN